MTAAAKLDRTTLRTSQLPDLCSLASGPGGSVMDASAAPVLEDSPVSSDRQSRPTNGQNPRNFKFERADWTLFRSISTLPQKAGVPARLLRRLVLK